MQPSAGVRMRGVWFLHPHRLPYPIHITWIGCWGFGYGCWNFKPLTEERYDLVEKTFDMFELIFSRWVEVWVGRGHVQNSNRNHHLTERWEIPCPLKNLRLLMR
jgi:hypothetical protein